MDGNLVAAAAEPVWPPSALELRNQHDVEFRRAAHHLAEVHGVSPREGIDSYATRIAATFDPSTDPDELADVLGGIGASTDLAPSIALWRAHLALEVARLYRR